MPTTPEDMIDMPALEPNNAMATTEEDDEMPALETPNGSSPDIVPPGPDPPNLPSGAGSPPSISASSPLQPVTLTIAGDNFGDLVHGLFAPPNGPATTPGATPSPVTAQHATGNAPGPPSSAASPGVVVTPAGFTQGFFMPGPLSAQAMMSALLGAGPSPGLPGATSFPATAQHATGNAPSPASSADSPGEGDAPTGSTQGFGMPGALSAQALMSALLAAGPPPGFAGGVPTPGASANPVSVFEAIYTSIMSHTYSSGGMNEDETESEDDEGDEGEDGDDDMPPLPVEGVAPPATTSGPGPHSGTENSASDEDDEMPALQEAVPAATPPPPSPLSQLHAHLMSQLGAITASLNTMAPPSATGTSAPTGNVAQQGGTATGAPNEAEAATQTFLSFNAPETAGVGFPVALTAPPTWFPAPEVLAESVNTLLSSVAPAVWGAPINYAPRPQPFDAVAYVDSLEQVDIATIPAEDMRCPHCWLDFGTTSEDFEPAATQNTTPEAAENQNNLDQMPFPEPAPNNDPVRTPCGHIFGRDCLIESLQKVSTMCPTCRQELRRPPQAAATADASTATENVAAPGDSIEAQDSSEDEFFVGETV